MANQSINQSINTDLYSAIRRRRIRGANQPRVRNWPRKLQNTAK